LLLALNIDYKRQNLPMSGVADLLGLGFGILDQEGVLGSKPAGEVVSKSRHLEEIQCPIPKI
jgi:hypothetical protein